ncbi:uncharacterized protein LOC125510842 [Triticum urartu]|nr:uncharacterized protein LOC125510842 [Triticum urartu]XP_048532071.1 uncharacterized protein LOC125510842 [Triticum urartu]XP_048532072.1 uncharacterized protein LOC125510842 [Triticum urartu]XP_048532073.1 uncharacterized protein LOC125510842 [Triticum urartu]
MHSMMNSSMKVTDVNMETEVPELLLVPNHVDSNGRHLPNHSPMKITDVDMKIEALTNYINLRRVGGEGGSMNVGNKKTKKKIFRVPQDELDEILLYQAAPAPAWQSAAKRYPWVVAEMEKIKVGFLAGQDKMRRQYEALGYATFEAEVTDDEQEEDAAVTTPYQDKDETLTTSFHERNDDAAVTTPYKENLEKDETSAASFHEKNDDAQAAAVTTPYKEKDETSAASFHEENDGAAATTSPWITPRGRGRRRFRPGVVKQACGVKKIT